MGHIFVESTSKVHSFAEWLFLLLQAAVAMSFHANVVSFAGCS